MIQPPYEVQQRAWECAASLKELWWDLVPLEQRIYIEVIYRTGPEGLGWHELKQAFVLYGQFVEVRV